MAAENSEKLRLYTDIYNADKHTDENALSNALLTQPDVLSPVLTHLAGREDKRFPLSFLTEGMGHIYYANDIEYDFPVIGRLNKSVLCTKLVSGTGANFTKIRLAFKEKWFNKGYLLEDPNGIQYRVVGEQFEGEDGWIYTLQISTTNPEDSIQAADVEGKYFVQLFSPNAISGSRGNDSNWVAPSKQRNQISLIRKSYGYEGFAPNKTVNVEFDINGRKTNLWYDFEEYQHMLRWKEECEYALWYSRYNRDSNGVIHLRDENNRPIPIGAGVLDQIPNFTTYTRLTATKLRNVVRDALYGATDSQEMNLVWFTGLGGLEEFDNAMKEEIATGQYIKNTDPASFITGSGRNLKFGGFFTSYQHIDGHTITVRHLPLFDHGARAKNSPRHPVTGLPLESYRMVGLDMSMYDGQPNVTYVTRKKREMVRWAVAGASIPPGFNGNATRANDIDGASVHFMKECGVSIRRATNCIHMQCVAA
jgi:hypothetical protein